ncbi:hypothetical protein [Pseudochelatococcus sp. G4_1912]|uniref:DUF4170 domain-containing protein n=1 Tax=Pseudochelatococcus sp. G4_1912 TaxID=3114288 RepID=UPI0039C6B447
MEHSRYWIVGGEYSDTDFQNIIPGTEQISGPFNSRDDVEEEWRRISERHRSQALMRFSIASERMMAGKTQMAAA